VTFPVPEEALKRHTAIVGMTGAGKSTTGRSIIEHIYAEGHRACILDLIKSDWWGLTSSADGKRPGLPFKILGGPRGHYRLPASAGKAIGELVGSGKLPHSIIDMADFEPGGPQRFFVDFVPSLIRNMKGVLYLFIEEAHEIAPKERAGFDKENMGVHYAKRIATGSRSRGIRMIVATQRVQSLHNAVLGSCETIITHRIGFHDDQVPVLKWMKSKVGKDRAAEVEAELANLPDGVAYIAAGAPAKIFERVKMPMFKTFDNTRTPDGDASSIEVKTAPVDADELRKLIGDSVKEAEENDIGKLQAKIRKLESELAKKPATVPAPPIERNVIQVDRDSVINAEGIGYAKGVAAGQHIGMGAAIEIVGKTPSPLLDAALKAERDRLVDKSVREAEEAKKKLDKYLSGPSPASMPPARPPMRSTVPPAARPSPATGGDGNLSTSLRKILDALSWWRALSITEPSYPQVAFRANYSPNGGTFNRYLSDLRSRDLIRTSNSRIVATESGLALAATYETPSAEALRADVLNQIDRPLAKMLSPLINSYPQPMTRDELGERSEYAASGGTFNRYLSSLRSLELVEEPERGHVRAADWLFP
jgi:hypothetical protein